MSHIEEEMDLRSLAKEYGAALRRANRASAKKIAADLHQFIQARWPRPSEAAVSGWDVCACVYAQALQRAGAPQQAAAFLEPLVAPGELLADDPVAHNTFAKALDNAGSSQAAADHLRSRIARGGLLADNPVAHNTFATALDNAGSSQAAADHLRSLIMSGGLLANNSFAHTTFAKALDNAGRPLEAADHLRSRIARGGLLADNPVAHNTFAKALDNAGRPLEAANHLGPLIAGGGLLAEDTFAYYTLARAQCHARLYGEARETLSRWAQENYYKHFMAATIEITAGKLQQAQPHIALAIKAAASSYEKLHGYTLLATVLPVKHPLLAQVERTASTATWQKITALAAEWQARPDAIDLPLPHEQKDNTN